MVQLVAEVSVLWSALAPVQTVVDLWQLSQPAEVARCEADFAVATVPLWQVEHPVLTVRRGITPPTRLQCVSHAAPVFTPPVLVHHLVEGVPLENTHTMQ